MITKKHLFSVILSFMVITCMLLSSACSQRYAGTSDKYDTASNNSSDYDSYAEDSGEINSADYEEDEDSYYEDSEDDNVSETIASKKAASDKKTNNRGNTAKKTNNNSYQNTKSNNSSYQNTRTNNSSNSSNQNTGTKKDNKSDWLHKEYYNYGNSIGDAEFGSWYDRAPITRKPYTTFDDIPDSDVLCFVNSGEHYFRLGETNKSASLVYCKGYTGYITDAYTSSDTYYDHQFSYNAPGVTLKKYNNEWVAYKNGPVTDYCGICPYEGTYWLISQGKVRTDISTIIHVYYDEGNNQKEAYLVIDEGEMVAIKSANNIVLWSN